jgi:pimeloyl-ACP methyl ester carboxylesterase
MEPTDTRVEVAPGTTLRVRQWPGTIGPPYLLVHGLSSNALLWDETAERLAAADRPAYAVDLRSHGESDSPDDGYDTATAAADLAAVSAALGLGPAIVAGQSWGGNVVVRLAATHPSAVAAVALVDGGWIDLSARFASWEECETALRPPEVDRMRPAELRGIIARMHPTWSARAVEATLANLRVTPEGRLARRLPIPKHMRIVRSMWDDPPWRDFPLISAPVLLLPAVPATHAEPANAAQPAEPANAAQPAEAADGDGDRDGEEWRRASVVKAATALARSRVKEYVGGDHDLHAQHPAELAADLLTLAPGA